MPYIEEYGRNVELREMEGLWAPLYEAVLGILGTSGIILPIGDLEFGQPNATTFKAHGDLQTTFTWSEPPNSFDTKLDLTDPDSFQGIIPIIAFNGTDEQMDTPDSADFTRLETGNPFTWGFWLNIDSASNYVLVSRWASGSELEYQVQLTAGKPELTLRDASAAVSVNRVADAAITAGVWRFVVLTYDSTGGSDAMGSSGSTQDNVTIYVDGAIVASTATDNGSYVAMENKAPVTALFYLERSNGNYYSGEAAGGPLGPFFTQIELTPDQVLRLYQTGRRGLAL